MFISPAYAQAAGAPADALTSFLPLILIFVVFYFLIIRPQSKKAKAHRAMLEAVRRGDKIVTSGGIVGVVTKVKDDSEIQVEIADNVRVRVMRHMIADVLTKTEPADKKSKDDEPSGDEEKKDA
ncbi:preprotein translocase subunit YajC [Kiloniella sp. b19]|uniref:preprotein translocase subunit YajC n=1 Tax=Kiloniella sp. GXU_MW_B19 TaxID=3141326 RepID=UPI0031E2C980